MQHPHIVSIHAVGEHEGVPYLSLEYMDGGNLAHKIARQPQPPREAARLTHLLADAMTYAHQHGVIHRDLKPANVLLQNRVTTINPNDTNQKTKKDTSSPGSSPTSDDSCDSWCNAVPKIADFGLAKCLGDDSGQTRTGTLMGTPAYMSPEQAEGGAKDLGPATDIWVLGVILYELLVGRTPFFGVTMMDTLEQVRTREPVPPTQLQPNVPTDLETICLKCLRKEPSQRYATCAVLAEDLRRFLAGEPILAHPIGVLERFGRWCRRNPRLAGLSAAVLLLLVTVAVTSTVFVFLLDARRREVERAWQEAENNAAIARRQELLANEHAREAQDRYRLTHEALGVVIDKVQRDLKTVPGSSRVRGEILEAAMNVLRKSVAVRQDSSRLPERSLASANMIMGDILLEGNKRDEAVEHYNQCHAILGTLYRANPDSDKAAGNFSVSLGKQGDLALAIRNDAAEAKALYQRALRIQDELLAHPPANAELRPEEVRRITANSHFRLGQIIQRIDPNALAEVHEHFQKACDLFEKVLPLEATLENQLRMEQIYYQRGESAERMDHREEALRAYDGSLALRKKLAVANPSDTNRQMEWLRLLGKVGDLCLFAGDTKTAQRYYREAIAPNEQLTRRDKQPGPRMLLSLNYYRLATAYLRLGDASAKEYYQKCLDVRLRLQHEYPNDLGLQIDVMIARGRCGLHKEAAAFARELRERFPNDPRLLVHAACGYTLAAPGVGQGQSKDLLTAEQRALRQHYFDRAIEALRQAKANGYKDVKNLQVEPDLDPLRPQGGFQAVMREYATPTPKK